MSGPAPTPKGFVPPNFRTARLVGIFNVLFASEILACGLFMGAYTATLPLWGRLFSGFQTLSEKQFEQIRSTQLRAAREQEEKAVTEREKIDAAARLIEIENRPKTSPMGPMDLNKLGIADPQMLAWGWVEILTGLVLNVMLLASGIGLMHWKPWACRLGIWTAALKVVRLVLVYGYFVLAIVPVYSQRVAGMVVDMLQKQGGVPLPPGNGDPRVFFTKIYIITYSGFGIGWMLVCLVYPVLLLWWLTRPGVRSACSGRWKLPKEPNQPC